MWFKKNTAIRKLIFFITAIVSFGGCVDTIPLPNEDGDRKLFVACEMTINENVYADVTFTGNTNGGLDPSQLMNPDTFDFGLAEGDKDFAVPFIFDKIEKRYIIKKESLQLKIGEKYKFRGIGVNRNSSEPIVSIPDVIEMDTIIIDKVSKSMVQNKFYTEVECRILFKLPTNTHLYFHIIPKSESNSNWSIKGFEKDPAAFKRLKHLPGLLVDQDRLADDEIRLTLQIAEEKDTQTLEINLFNTTHSYYQYNYYISNITSDSYGQNNEIPAIAGLNIKTDKAFGTFSAKTLSTKKVTIK